MEFRRDAIEKPPVPVTEDLTINLNAGAGAEAKNTSGTNTVDWDGSVISDVSSGSGDDTITGNLIANTIRCNSGEDNISGLKGDDEIDVRDGLGGDVVNCGEDGPSNADNDSVFFDAGDSVVNCETLNP